MKDEPPGVVTMMSHVPIAPAGALTTIDVSLTETMVALFIPKVTEVAPVKYFPVIVTAVPPLWVAGVPLTLVTIGVG
jgi:hypothetical protein